MSRVIAVLGLMVFMGLVGCVEEASPESGVDPLVQGQQFVESAEFRRQALVESIVDGSNGYSALRLSQYGLTDESGMPTGWDATPEYNPLVRPVTVDDIGLFAPNTDGPSPEGATFAPVYGGELRWTHDEVMALGKRAFEQYPLQLDRAAGALTESHELAQEYGLWTDNRGRLGGLVRVQLPGGNESFAKTCSTCHARPDELGDLVHGAANARFDLGGAIHRRAVQQGSGGESLRSLLGWGRGQVDVTPDGVNNPVAITDLRPIRYQQRLNWAGTLENSLPALAVRVETLIITSLGQATRPPHEVSFAIAYYLWHLGERGDNGEPDTSLPGADVFAEECAGCHRLDGTTIGAIPISAVGTEPSVGQSSTRGVFGGMYRVPSLFKVSDRRQLLHHGQLESLTELLSAERLQTWPGHEFGTDLSNADKDALIRFLETM